jgi:hypothetical protein
MSKRRTWVLHTATVDVLSRQILQEDGGVRENSSSSAASSGCTT